MGGAGGMAGAGGMSGSGGAGAQGGMGGAGGGLGGMGGAGGAVMVCPPGDVQPCYTGPQGTQDVGACKAGTMTCDAMGAGYGPCTGEVTPQPETCFTPEDDDCNGQANEGGIGCACLPSTTASCYTGPAGTLGVGACAAGTHTCNIDGTAYGPCTGEVTPAIESCATAADDNCDGQINEGCACAPNSTASCYSGAPGTAGVGACKAGTMTCNAQGTAYGPCTGEVTPVPEACGTAADDNCDGQINEGCVCVPNAVVSCYSGPMGTAGVGACKAGTQTCNAQGTAFGPCTGEVTPVAESCATPIDDNCNGQVNEGCACVPNSTASCYSGPAGTAGVGVCKAGTQTCNAQGTAYGPCVGEVTPSTESCLDASDNNCDGQVNEGCICAPNSTTSCYTGPQGTLGVGACAAGTKTCAADGKSYGPCAGEVTPVAETCNTPVDDDCNGQTNEGGAGCACAPNSATSCYTGPAGTLGVGVCASGMKTCNSQGTAYGACIGEVTPSAETCNTSVDDDCNGQTNEGGVGCVCLPNMPTACYTGPAGTLGVGICAAGTALCNSQGTGMGACSGDVLPKLENCATAADEDCNGSAALCAGNHLWSKGWGGSADDETNAVAADKDNNVIVAGYLTNTVDFGCGPITGTAGGSSVVIKLDPNGNCLWSKAYAGISAVSSVAADSAGNVIFTGRYYGTIDLGGGVHTEVGSNGDIYVAKLGADGSFQWSKSAGDSQQQLPRSIAVDPSDNILTTGINVGTVNFGGGNITTVGGIDVYLVKYSPAGAHIWSKGFGNAGNQIARSVTSDASGNVYIAGDFSGTANFGGSNLVSAGLADAFVVKLTSAGAHVWSKGFGDAADQTGFGVVVDAAGDVYATGSFNGTMSFGGAPITSLGGTDVWLVKLTTAGAHVWSKGFGGPSNQTSIGVVVDKVGNVSITGALQGTADFGGGPLTSAGGNDVFVAKYDTSGNHLWSHSYGDAGAQTPQGIAVRPDGAVISGGLLLSPCDFGGGPVAGLGAEDLFVVVLTP